MSLQCVVFYSLSSVDNDDITILPLHLMMMIDAAAAVLEACSSSDVRACATAGKRPYEQS